MLDQVGEKLNNLLTKKPLPGVLILTPLVCLFRAILGPVPPQRPKERRHGVPVDRAQRRTKVQV